MKDMLREENEVLGIHTSDVLRKKHFRLLLSKWVCITSILQRPQKSVQ